MNDVAASARLRSMKLVLLAAAAVLPFAAATAQKAARPSAALVEAVQVPYETFTLSNGLRVIVHTDRKAPIVNTSIAYHVGSKDERQGRTGFAHLFEHLMFYGSEHHNKDWFAAMQEMGATGFNGTTSPDRTFYYQNVPTPALERILFLESDRMGHLLPAVDQAKLDAQRGVVQNEMRQLENQPYGRTYSRIIEGLYPVGHPYRHSEIGSMEDLNAATLDDVKTFFRNWYGPNNAVLTLAGDIDAATARPLVEKYFGAIPPGPAIPKRLQAWVPENELIVRETMQDQVANPRIYRAWAAPGLNNPEAQYLQIAAIALAGGENSRLHVALVRDEQVATQVTGLVQANEAASVVQLRVTVKPGVDPRAAERRVDAIVDQFIAEGPTAEEVDRVGMSLVSTAIRGIEGIGGYSGKASRLTHGAMFSDEPLFFKTELKRYATATREQVRAAAARWMADGDYQLLVEPYGALQASASSLSRSTLPPLGAPPALDFPEVERARLSNGIEVVFARRAAVPVVELAMTFDAGNAADPRGKLGTQALMLSLLERGTDRRSAVEIAQSQERMGADISTSIGSDTAEVSLSALTTTLAPSIDIWADVIRNPRFAPDELERERALQLARIAQDQSNPSALAARLLPAIIYGNQPYGVPPTGNGTAEGVAAVTRADIDRFHETWIRPDTATIFAVGDTNLATLMPLLEERFGDWRAPSTPRGTKSFGTVASSQGERIIIVDRPGAPQSLIYGGYVLPVRGRDDPLTLQLANFPLGNVFTSRLNANLREKRGWSYGVATMMPQMREQMPFYVQAPVQTDQTAPALTELRQEIRAYVSAKPVTDQEIGAAVTSLTGSLPGAYESNAAVLSAMKLNARLGFPDDYQERTAGRLRALTRAEVEAAARGNLDTGKVVWIVIGDRTKIEAPLRQLGLPVEVQPAG